MEEFATLVDFSSNWKYENVYVQVIENTPIDYQMI